MSWFDLHVLLSQVQTDMPDRTFIPVAFSTGVTRQIPGVMGIEPFSVTNRLLLVSDKLIFDGFPFFPTGDGINY